MNRKNKMELDCVACERRKEKVCKTMGVFGLILIFITCKASSEQNEQLKSVILPPELQTLALQSGLTEISDFFELQQMFPDEAKPAYLWGYDEELPPKQSAVFWTQDPADSLRDRRDFYILIAFRESQDSSLEVIDSIKWVQPGGLSWFLDSSVALGDFVYLENVEKHGPSGEKIRHKAILSSGEGFQTIFYKHNDDWLILDKYDW
jgi:hypothetical protein